MKVWIFGKFSLFPVQCKKKQKNRRKNEAAMIFQDFEPCRSWKVRKVIGICICLKTALRDTTVLNNALVLVSHDLLIFYCFRVLVMKSTYSKPLRTTALPTFTLFQTQPNLITVNSSFEQ